MPFVTGTLWGPGGMPALTDVEQGATGDCGPMATMAAVAYSNPTAITKMFTDNGNGTYTVKIYNDSVGPPYSPVYVTVDGNLPFDGNGNMTATFVNDKVLWPALLEKAFAEYDYPAYNYNLVPGSFAMIMGLPTKSASVDPTTMATALAAHEFVNLTTGTPVDSHVPGGHYMTVLAHTGTVGQPSSEFLIFNPWGFGSVAKVTTPPSKASTIDAGATTIPVDSSTYISAGDTIKIDGELMYVTGTTATTLSVKRDYDNTTPASHQVGAAVYLVLHRGDPFGPNDIAQPPDKSGGFSYLLWWFSDAQVLANYDGLSCTTSPWGAPPLADSAASAAHFPPAVVGSLAQSLPPGPAADNLLTMLSPTQATTPDPSQESPAQVAAGSIPVNRLKAVDAVFAAGNVADQDRTTRLDGGNRANDDTDASFVPDGVSSWGVQLARLKTGPRKAAA